MLSRLLPNPLKTIRNSNNMFESIFEIIYDYLINLFIYIHSTLQEHKTTNRLDNTLTQFEHKTTNRLDNTLTQFEHKTTNRLDNTLIQFYKYYETGTNVNLVLFHLIKIVIPKSVSHIISCSSCLQFFLILLCR